MTPNFSAAPYVTTRRALSRRHFLRGAGASSLLAPAFIEQALLMPGARAESLSDGSGRILVLLELNGGRAAQLGIGPGDRVDW